MNDSGRPDDQTRRLGPGDNPEATRVSDTSRKETGPATSPTAPTSPTSAFTTAGPPTGVFVPGQTLLSRYTLIKLLGRGGFGAVWMAHDEELRMDVAIKFLSELIISNPDAIEDLKRETRYSLRLTHPNIVRTYGFIQSPEVVGIAMEYVSGGTLVHMRAGRPRRCFGPTEIAAWVLQLCEALDYAHNKVQIIHRDLKPANLMIDDARDLKIADFGISRSVSDSRTRMTNDRDTSGTLAYMSPQQMMGESARPTDDVYSLGATLYDLLTGKPPFYTGDIVQQVWRARPPTVEARRRDLDEEGESLPPEWEEVLAACLEKESENRPASAMEVAERLGLRSASAGRTSATAHSMPAALDPGATRALPVSQDYQPTRVVTPGSTPITPPRITPPGAPVSRSAPAAASQHVSATPLDVPREQKKLPLPLLIGGALAAALAVGLFLVFRPKPEPPPRIPDSNTTAANPSDAPLFTGSNGTGATDPAAGSSDPTGATGTTGNPPITDPAGDPPEDVNAARIPRIRRAIAQALKRKDYEEAARGVTELLKLAPGDPEALQQKGQIAEMMAKEARVSRLRQSIPAAIAAKNVAKGEADITELLSIAPGDAQALRWRQELIAIRDGASTRPDPPQPDPPKSDPPKTDPPKTDDRPADTAAQDREGIRAVITGYERALESLNADQYAKLWAGFSGDEKKRLAQSFADLKSMSVDIQVGSIDVSGETGSASLHEKRTLAFKAGKDQALERDVTLRFRKSGEQWVIVKLETR